MRGISGGAGRALLVGAEADENAPPPRPTSTPRKELSCVAKMSMAPYIPLRGNSWRAMSLLTALNTVDVRIEEAGA